MNFNLKRFIVYLSAAASLFGSARALESESDAYKIITLKFSTYYDISDNMYHNYWSRDIAFALKAETPFYYGNFIFGLFGGDHNSDRDEYYEYSSLFIHAGWGMPVKLTDKITYSSSIVAGNYLMLFDTSDDLNLESLESELALGAGSELDFLFKDKFLLTISAAYLKIYTNHRIHQFYIGAGIGYSFDMPKLLLKVLR